jgi:hypothetical protein
MDKAKKFLVFDAGPLISLGMNGILPILKKLKNEFPGEFIITPAVKQEVIDKPLKIKKFEFNALEIKDLLDKGVLRLSSDFIKNDALEKETRKLGDILNSCLKVGNRRIELFHKGEISCLAFANLCDCENAIVTDERTVKMVIEAPEVLKDMMEEKLHMKLRFEKKELDKLKKFRFIRSAELLFIAYEKDLFDIKKDKSLLDAVLYAVKFNGTAISSHEIEVMKSLA